MSVQPPAGNSMRARVLAVVAAFATLAGVGAANAQDFRFDWNPRSGDSWVDSQLEDVNRYGVRYRQSFIDEMVRYYGAPRDLVETLLADERWAPGDIYYACAVARILGRPCRHVVEIWDRDHAQGWRSVAEQLGVTAESALFERLKRGFVPTYDRWGRPIEIDTELSRHYPERARAAK